MRRGILDVLERVRSLAVDRVVADDQVLVGHPEWNSADVLDEQADQAGPDHVPANDEACASELPADLDTIAGNTTTGREGGEGNRALAGREDTDEEATADTGDQVSVEDAENVINGPEEGQALAKDVHCAPWNAAGNHADDDSTPASDDTYASQSA